MSLTQTTTSWIEPFDTAADDLPGRELPWVVEMRAAARDRFRTLGWPTRRFEEWRYTDVSPIARAAFSPARGGAPARGEVETALARLPGGGKFHRLVFVDGVLVRPLTILHDLPAGVRVLSLVEALTEIPDVVQAHLGQYALYESNAVTALNTAFWRDGVVIHVPRGVALERPIEAIYLATSGAGASAAHVRNLVVCEESARVDLVEVWHAAHAGAYFNNVTTEVVAAPNASVRHVRVQEEGKSAHHIGNTRFHARRDARVSSFVITTGGATSRNDLEFTLAEPGASCELNGLYVLNGRQKADNYTLVDHASPQCKSSEFYKGVLDGVSEGSFTGRVVVRQDAQQTDAEQSNRNLLLSDDARVNTRPQLEIYADDVKCSHGATSGQLDRHALFYLRSRGIDHIRARQILTRAFASEIIASIPIGPVRDHLLPVVEDRLCPGHLLEEGS
ncbi:MAG: Fe-S cluster assembly protein SufD [Planctomycetes bacterium]|nr:Fe-S cluster assembly protein SufD [Planctomycetota bacterium]